MTCGEYYTAASGEQLQKVFDSLTTILIVRAVTTENGVLFAAFYPEPPSKFRNNDT